MDGSVELPLTGGAQTEGLVRVGDTVRRPAEPRAAYVDAVLHHLADVGFQGAPRPLGYDDQGRQIVSFVPGLVPAGLPYRLSDDRIHSATRLIRAFNDATATSPLRGAAEVVCHGDLGPHNTVFRGDVAVAIIDWDDDLGPGRRAVDVAHAVWCFADVTEDSVPVAEQARKARLMCDEYPGVTPAVVVSELAARFHRARDAHARADRPGGVAVFDRLLGWVDRHGAQLAAG